jgi:hypothetical protein
MWSFTPRVEDRFGVFENRILRKVFGPEWEDESRLEKTA